MTLAFEFCTMNINDVSGQVVQAAMVVHTALGPGLLESAYRSCLAYEIAKRGLRVDAEVAVPLNYDGLRIDVGYRLDLLVEGLVIVELKACERLVPLHTAQLLSHLRLTGRSVGLLINFSVPRLRDGIRRIVNELPPADSLRGRSGEGVGK